MTGFLWPSRTGVLLTAIGVGLLSGGCATLPIPIGQPYSERGLEWTSSGEVTTLSALYDYTDQLRNIGAEQRRQEFQRLERIPAAQRTIRQRLSLAILIGGIDPGLTDYVRARDEYRAVFEEVAGQPMLSGYVRDKIDFYNRLSNFNSSIEKLHLEKVRLEQINREIRRAVASRDDRDRASRLPSTAADPTRNADLTTPEDVSGQTRTDPTVDGAGTVFSRSSGADGDTLLSPFVGPSAGAGNGATRNDFAQLADLEWNQYIEQLREELSSAQTELKAKDDIIAEQANTISDLEAKLGALTAIERNLSNRETTVTSDLSATSESTSSTEEKSDE